MSSVIPPHPRFDWKQLMRESGGRFYCRQCGAEAVNVEYAYDPTGKKTLVWAECHTTGCLWGWGEFTGSMPLDEVDGLFETTRGEFKGRGRRYSVTLEDCPGCGSSRLDIEKVGCARRKCTTCERVFVERDGSGLSTEGG